MFKTIFTTTTLLAIAAMSAHAGEPLTRTVKYADLKIDSVQGAHSLYVRINAAARKVCEPVHYSGGLSSQRAYQACLKAAVDDAVAYVNSPELTAASKSKTGTAVRLASR